MLTFDQLRAANVERCEKTFHKLCHWSINDWVTATLGELGEAANVAKKLRRLDGGAGFTRPTERNVAELHERLADEIADAMIYLDLLAARCGFDLGEAVRNKFNRTSAEVGSQVKL